MPTQSRPIAHAHMPAESRPIAHSGRRSDTHDKNGAKRGSIAHAVAALARAQKDVVTLPEVLSCGLSASGADNWIRSGRLHPKYPGVYAFGRPDLTPEGHRMAAVKACGPGAALSFVSAASHRGFRASASAYVDVTIPRGRPLLRLKGIRCHLCDLAPQDLTEFEGIPLTSVSRTLLDLACVLRPGALEYAAKQAVIIEAFDMREVEDLLRRDRRVTGAFVASVRCSRRAI